MNIKQLKEYEFLLLCGFDDSNGFWSEDVEHYKTVLPELYDYIVNGEPVKLKGQMATCKMYLEVQQKQLLEWKSKLNNSAYKALCEWVETENEKALLSNKVFNSHIVRGDDLLSFISNYKG